MARSVSLDEMIAHARGMVTLPLELARAIAPELDAALKRQIAASKGPDGKAWDKRQDGGHALVNAGSYLQVRVVDMGDGRAAVRVVLPKPIALHDLGIARGGVKRQILPEGDLQGHLAAAVKQAAEDYLRRRR